MLTYKEMTAEEFIAFVEQHPDKRFDFMDGEVVEVSPKQIHGRIQVIFAAAFSEYTRSNLVGVVHSEVLHAGENRPGPQQGIRRGPHDLQSRLARSRRMGRWNRRLE